MKTLLLTLFLLVATLTTKAQTYMADTLRYFEDVQSPLPDTTLVEEITIKIDKNILTIDKFNAHFKATIIDTLDIEVLAVGVYMKKFNIKTEASLNGYVYTMQLLVVYVDGKVRTIGLSRGTQLFMYHIVDELINANARR